MVAVLDKLIEATPGVLGGKPRIAGHRISVQHVALLYTRSGMSAEGIAKMYNLAPAAVHAALAYYYEDRDAIERKIREDEEFYEAGKRAQAALRRKRPRVVKHG
jgi:uncharacterized protein (DUF433 family)